MGERPQAGEGGVAGGDKGGDISSLSPFRTPCPPRSAFRTTPAPLPPCLNISAMATSLDQYDMYVHPCTTNPIASIMTCTIYP
jgi:hypothetical protein